MGRTTTPWVRQAITLNETQALADREITQPSVTVYAVVRFCTPWSLQRVQVRTVPHAHPS